MTTFKELGLQENLLKAVEDLGFETPSPVQEQTVPMLLQEDIDLVALAQTGTGKTAAFGLPIIQKIDASNRETQALILSPTRELCLQITRELELYAKYEKKVNVTAIYGGASIRDQAQQIKRGSQIVVATPGRMKDMLRRKMVDISAIKYCVLDEADEMLNMGFYEDINAILAHSPDKKKTWLFSATMPKEVSKIAKKFMKEPAEVTVGTKNVGAVNVSHEFYLVSGRHRYEVLKRLADVHPGIFSVVFCRTKRETQRVAEKLVADGYNAGAIHGDLSQSQRDMVMGSFRKKQIQFLVATDVAARGIDVSDITHVINYQLPDEIEIYTHRSGRTGRAGKKGTSIVILTKGERGKIKRIERMIKQQFEQKPIPSGKEIVEKQLYQLASNVKTREINSEIEQYLPKVEEELAEFSREELIQKFFSVEFSRFLDDYKNADDLNAKAKSEPAGRDKGGSFGGARKQKGVRFFINLGEKDGLQWQDLKDVLKDQLNLGKSDIFNVDTKAGFSFFNTEMDQKDKVLETLNGSDYKGRQISVEITKDSGDKKSKGKGEKKKFKGEKKGKRKSNIDSSLERRKKKRKRKS
jgi:ATP-dependent RNA helicase DeaD